MKASRLVAIACAVAALAGCHRAPPGPSLTSVPFALLPGWAEDHPAAALPGLLADCAHLVALPAETPLGLPGQALPGFHAGDWRGVCARAATVMGKDAAAARAYFEQDFTAYRLEDSGNSAAEFTGYYEPEMAGSLVRDGKFTTPLLGRPDDLIQADLGRFIPDLHGRSITGRVAGHALVPYFSRAEIERGALDGQHLELLFVADPVDAFFLQVQGSGRVDLPDGSVVRVAYAAQNGLPYVAIGRKLVERGALPQDGVTMQAIRAWLAAHPQEVAQMLDENPSYVFFRLRQGVAPDQGPPGALGVPLVPGRSIAVDRGVIPLGAPVWLDTTDPADGSKFQRLMLAQDTGGAIKGARRADIFFGWGEAAEQRAGAARQPGTQYVLLPKVAS